MEGGWEKGNKRKFEIRSSKFEGFGAQIDLTVGARARTGQRPVAASAARHPRFTLSNFEFRI
jgi:hypothetical protein